MPKASIDHCGNCRFWDQDDEELTPQQVRDGLGVCRIMSYPEEFANGFAFVSNSDAVVIVAGDPPEDEPFHCTLYKVAS